MDIQVALEAAGRIFPWIDDESAATTDLDMFAGRPMTRFAAGHVRKLDVALVEFAVCARWKNARDICVTAYAGGVPHIMSAFDVRWGNDRPADTATRCEQSDSKGECAHE
jgi:hypothetical protein